MLHDDICVAADLGPAGAEAVASQELGGGTFRHPFVIVVAVGALGLTACTYSSPQRRARRSGEHRLAPLAPVASKPPITPPSPIPPRQQFIDAFVGMLYPRARRVDVCPGLRARPAQSRQAIRRSFDIAPLHEAAARFGYSNDEFVDMIMSAYSKRLEAEC